MYLSDAYRIHAYWEEIPPLRDLVYAIAGSLGVEMKRAPGVSENGHALVEIPEEFED